MESPKEVVLAKELIPPAPPPKPAGKLPPAVTAPAVAANPAVKQPISRKDSQTFHRSRAKHHVPPALQKETIARIFRLGKTIHEQGKIPVVVIDHRQAGLDDYPIVRKAFEVLVNKHNIVELKDIEGALAKGALKFLPGYTSQASDHWRQSHQALTAKYAAAFGKPSTRIEMGFMSYPVTEANAAAGLLDFFNSWKLSTDGLGEMIFCGAGTGTTGATVSGTVEEFRSVYIRPREQGGGGLIDPDVRFGAPDASQEAWERAQELAWEYDRAHPHEPSLHLDGDTRAKMGWIETIEREKGRDGREKVVIAFIDDRAHNRVGAQAASKLGPRMLAVKAVPPGLSYSQADNYNENQLSTFYPNPL
jgi:hypothetical protein